MNSVHFKRGALVSLAVAFGGLAANGAFANGADVNEPNGARDNAITIQYSELDLASPEGVQALYRRVATAARQLCQEPNVRELSRYSVYQTCFRETVSSAVENVNIPQLSALHRTKSTWRRAG